MDSLVITEEPRDVYANASNEWLKHGNVVSMRHTFLIKLFSAGDHSNIKIFGYDDIVFVL